MFKFQETVSPNVVQVKIDFDSINDEQWLLLRGDCHHDHPKSDRDLEKKHLDEAKACGAGIIDVGDLFCAMQGKFDRRSSKSDIRPEHQSGDYLDALVRTAADFYEPYAGNILALGIGNHEVSIKDRHESCLTTRLAQTLRDRTGAAVPVTGYTGWIRIVIDYKGNRTSVVLWHHHGYGGGGPVTKDTIQSQRQQAYVDGADIMVSGHVHERWVQEHTKTGLTDLGEVKNRQVWYVKTGSYKDDFGTGRGGWQVGTGKPPKPLGGWWARLTVSRTTKNGKTTFKPIIEITPTT